MQRHRDRLTHGQAAFDFLQYFDEAIGCDASEGMIGQAIKSADGRGLSNKAVFFVAGAEECNTAVTKAGRDSVDAITVATAAHWFDMQPFYAAAAKALRSGGTLAMWTNSSSYVHPSTPKAKDFQAILSDLEDNLLKPYMQPGSLITRSGYELLDLPWTDAANKSLFDESTFKKLRWDVDGIPSAPPLPDGTPGPFIGGRSITFEQAEMAMACSSPVIRWREAHPDKVGTEEDVVRATFKRIAEVGPDPGKIVFAPSYSLLLMRKV